MALKKLKGRVERGEVVITPRDKSGKFCIMSLSTYEGMGFVHTQGDKIVNEDELKQVQNNLNNIAHVPQSVQCRCLTWRPQCQPGQVSLCNQS